MEGTTSVLITCPSGLTSAMLATRMNRRAAERGLALTFDSMAVRNGQGALEKYDAVLLSPGIQSREAEFRQVAPKTPIATLPMMVYGRMAADAAIDQALALLPEEARDAAEGVDPELEERVSVASGAGPKRLYVCCGGGMSSSLLATKIADELKERNLNVEVRWTSAHKLEFDPVEADCILVAPQVSPMLERLQAEHGDRIPVALMSMQDYGTMNAKAIVNQALLLMAERDLAR